MKDAGEGVFLKINVEAETVIAFYNGKRVTDTDTEDWEECSYRIFLNDDKDEVLDIPENMIDTSNYSATLAHKINHSFRPNCRFRYYRRKIKLNIT